MGDPALRAEIGGVEPEILDSPLHCDVDLMDATEPSLLRVWKTEDPDAATVQLASALQVSGWSRRGESVWAIQTDGGDTLQVRASYGPSEFRIEVFSETSYCFD